VAPGGHGSHVKPTPRPFDAGVATPISGTSRRHRLRAERAVPQTGCWISLQVNPIRPDGDGWRVWSARATTRKAWGEHSQGDPIGGDCCAQGCGTQHIPRRKADAGLAGERLPRSGRSEYPATSVPFSNYAIHGRQQPARTRDSTTLSLRSMVRMGPLPGILAGRVCSRSFRRLMLPSSSGCPPSPLVFLSSAIPSDSSCASPTARPYFPFSSSIVDNQKPSDNHDGAADQFKLYCVLRSQV
jgi:hypothetical protein